MFLRIVRPPVFPTCVKMSGTCARADGSSTRAFRLGRRSAPSRARTRTRESRPTSRRGRRPRAPRRRSRSRRLQERGGNSGRRTSCSRCRGRGRTKACGDETSRRRAGERLPRRAPARSSAFHGDARRGGGGGGGGGASGRARRGTTRGVRASERGAALAFDGDRVRRRRWREPVRPRSAGWTRRRFSRSPNRRSVAVKVRAASRRAPPPRARPRRRARRSRCPRRARRARPPRRRRGRRPRACA